MWRPPEERLQRLSPRLAWLALGAVLVFALALRVFYLSVDLNLSRYWDERYSLENVTPILQTGTLEPSRGFYPSPVFNLPAAGAVRVANGIAAVTGKQEWAGHDGTRYYPGAFFALRLQQALYSVGAIFVTFLIGRRLFSRAAALLGAALVAGMAWHIQQASVFKPDSLLNLTVMGAFWLSLRLLDRPSWGRCAATGLAIALAMSAKMTGGLVALPLTFALLAGARREPRRLAYLVATGVTSAASFVLMNPYWRRYAGYLEHLSRDYAMRAGWREWEHWQIPGRTLAFLLDPTTLGPVLGGLGLLAFAALTFAVARPGGLPLARRAELSMLVTFPLVFVVAYAIQTAYFKANNFLPLAPLFALLAAHVLVEGWSFLGRRFPASPPIALSALAGSAALVVALSPGFLYVYRALVPTTLHSAEVFVVSAARRKPRVVFAETVELAPWYRTLKPFAKLQVDDLLSVPTGRLDRADGEIFAESRLRGPDAERYRKRMDRVGPKHRRIFRPWPFRLRGPALVAVRHTRRERAPVRELELAACGRDCWASRDDPLDGAGALVSFAVHAPKVRVAEVPPPRLRLDGEEIPLHWVDVRMGFDLYHSERVVVGDAELELMAASPEPYRPFIHVYRWRRPGRGKAAPPAEPGGS